MALETVAGRPGIQPCMDPLSSYSRILDPHVVGEEHYQVTREVQRCCSATVTCRTSSPSRIDELSEDDKQIVGRARRIQRFLTQPFFVAEVYTESPAATCRSARRCEASVRFLRGSTTTCGAGVLPWSDD